MSMTPPTISPRPRSRESLVASPRPPLAPTPAPPAGPALRILIRLPRIAEPAAAANRYRFAAMLFSTLKRKYATAAFAVFCVAMIAIFMHGRHKKSAPNDLGSEAPLWNGGIAVSPVGQSAGQQSPLPQSTGPIFPAARGGAQASGAAPWAAHEPTLADQRRRGGPPENSWQPPANGAPVQASQNPNSNVADQVPNMPLRNPAHNGADAPVGNRRPRRRIPTIAWRGATMLRHSLPLPPVRRRVAVNLEWPDSRARSAGLRNKTA